MPKTKLSFLENIRKANNNRVQFYFLMAAICVHFSNYFYSGLAKIGITGPILADTGPLSWALENQTQNLILTSSYMGTLPIATLSGVPEAAFTLFSFLVQPMNIFVLVTQLLCVVCIFRVSYTRIVTALYDFFHIMVFVTSGILFWKWIILNAALVISLKNYKDCSIPPIISIVFAGLIIASPLCFFVAKLAWLDTRALNAAYFEVTDTKGHIYKVPSNYFGPVSVTIAQMRLGRNFDGFFKTGTFGNIYSYQGMKSANKCYLKNDETTKALTDDKLKTISNLVSTHHDYVLERIDQNGRMAYDLFPHHIWSNPYLYKSFYMLDKKDIESYHYVISAVCLDYKNGKIHHSILKEQRYDFPITKQ